MPRPTTLVLTSQQALELLAEVSAAVAVEHQDLGVVRAFGEALGHRVPWRTIEITERHKPDPIADVVTLSAPGLAPTRSRRSWRESAGDSDASSTLILPLGERSERSASATVVLVQTVKLDPAARRALAAVLAGAWHPARLVARVAAVSRRAHAEREYLRDELQRHAHSETLVVASPVMRRLLDESVDLVARHDTTVLLRGESGVGKEVIARRIHALSSRAARPMLTVNCGALPETLVESALFGHERGAFTGANARQFGLFERANHGTLLLDEVAELPLSAQVKLLRVLQDGEFERVGGQSPLRVDVRVIAATHRPLQRMVARGAFRADLFYRLSVFPIEIPPLRERPEDIAALARAFVERLARKHGRRAPTLTATTIARLLAYTWPGNVRELENVLERALVLSAGETLTLPDGFETTALPPRPGEARRTSEGIPGFSQAARAAIERALAASNGRIHGPGGAAALLGLKPTTLQSKMKRLKVRRERFVVRERRPSPR